MKEQTKSAAFALLAAVLYAVGTPLSKVLLGGVGPVMMAALLYLGAGIGLLLLGGARRLAGQANRELPLTRGELPYTIGMVVLDIAAPILLMVGLTMTSAAGAALLNNFEIVATALIALLVFREPVSGRLWLAIVLVTAASILLSVEDLSSFTFSAGSLLVLGASVCWGLENNCTRMLSGKDPLQIVVIKGFGSGLGSLCIALVLGESLPAVRFVLPALLVGFVAYGLSIFFYIRAQRGIGAARTSTYYAVAPFISTGLSLVLFRQWPSAQYWAALALMLAGAYYASTEAGHSHAHNGVHSIDYFAYTSRLSGWNPTFKVVFSAVSLVICIAADNLFVSVFFVVVMMALIVGRGGLPMHDYLALLSIPVFFMAVSGLTIAFNIARTAHGEYGWDFGLFYLYTSRESLWYALSLTCKALGAVSAMYFMTLTTPACEIVSVLRRAHMPKLIIELMYLIYRFIFILLDVYGRMREAAESRLGYRDFRTSCKSFGGTVGNMLVLSMRKAGTYYDAMLSRCYQGEMQFLEPEKPACARQYVLAGATWAGALVLGLLTKGGI
ncbi:MAG: cobalt ECF transporter T component CbiQ [Butyricicoccus sp.]